MEAEADLKKSIVAKLIEQFYQQLTTGCGRETCTTPMCASNKNFNLRLEPSEAALKAIELVKNKADRCSYITAKASDDSLSTTSISQPEDIVGKSDVFESEPLASKVAKLSPCTNTSNYDFLGEKLILKILENKEKTTYSKLKDILYNAFSTLDNLCNSFLPSEEINEADYKRMEIDEEEEEIDKEIGFRIDVASLRRSYDDLLKLDASNYMPSIIHGLEQLSTSLPITFKTSKMPSKLSSKIAHAFVVILELPFMQVHDCLEDGLKSICKVAANLPLPVQERLARFYALSEPSKRLESLIQTLLQYITLKVLSNERNVASDLSVQGATVVMKCFYYASILGGECDDPKLLIAETSALENESNSSGFAPKTNKQSSVKDDPLSSALKVKPINCKKPLINYDCFINEPLSDALQLDNDYLEYKQDKFSFYAHSFILTTTAKVTQMFYENKWTMLNERRQALINTLFQSVPVMPYLKLHVRREHIVDDALVALEASATEDPSELRKQLYVEFEGEQGIDEGGLSKEFFQLICAQLFNPDYGMFIYSEETRTYFFNPSSFENDAQFTLIGIVLGLAIYNNIILDIRFPPVVYRKLMGKLGTLSDLSGVYPVISSSLKQLLVYEGDVENDFIQPFCITYDDLFDGRPTVDLKEGGCNILVNNENREEFVELYTDFLLNKRIERQFAAFRRGFKLVTDESPLSTLFRPEEVELLICGSEDFNFEELEKTTEYDGGYDQQSDTIRHFWELVHQEFTEEQKKQLLQFTTGSDRVPVGGLSKLKLIIARNGPDSDRLPTAHTCFNVLLIPDYKRKDKLRERLLKAIIHTKGFGML
ncbi:DgyrCDS11247 [Dimorphilus gyrociliatus]|uniref:HECT-type E3 ubiquitin transferase n=1 Tax=Dimorphilus gyrociliatus TaxID=2664684 RepID=A0A7I8W413_9ANNE|nr:DgyrCDS11247 [Dimorphilus gyrociliatus]